MSVDPSEVLYGRFTVADLCPTDTGLDNLPEDSDLPNMRWMAKVLTQLEVAFGPFQIFSCFRSPAVQDRVENRSPAAQSKKSFHELGMAADLKPYGMSIEEMFGRVLASEWKDKLGEIILKADQGTLHLGLPTASVRSKVMIHDKSGYRLATDQEIADYSGPYIAEMSQGTPPADPSTYDQPYSLNDPSGGLYDSLFSQPVIPYKPKSYLDFNSMTTQTKLMYAGALAAFGYLLLQVFGKKKS